MRFLFFVLVPILAALGFLLAPRPFLKPDWRTPYEAAVAAGDCEKIERIVGILLSTGLGWEAFKEQYANYEAGRCKYAHMPEDEIELLESQATYRPPSLTGRYLNKGFYTSPLGRFYYTINREKHPASKFVRNAERSLLVTRFNSCEDVVRPIFEGRPNYKLLGFALENEELPAEAIDDIAREQRAACAAKIMADVKVIALAARTPEEFAILLRYLTGASLLDGAAPTLGPEIQRISELVPEESYRIAGWMRENDRMASFECEAWYGDRVLEGAIKCAVAADEAVGERDYADAYALYYARRAERLGWRDLNTIEARARARLTPECASAIVAVEEAEAEGADEPRDYETRQLWTVTMNEGGPCAAGEEGPTASGQE